MATYDLIATATFGVESIVADELRTLGYQNLTVENGRVSFAGETKDIARCNIALRTSDRVLIRMAAFKATDFEELFQQTRSIGWEDFIPVDGKMHVVGKSHKSALSSVPDCQSIVKKAIVEAMKRRHRVERFSEAGPVYKIEVGLLNDVATLTVDTSGPGLHKRGYRMEKGETPLRETLAAALVKLSRWEPGREFADPFCGSGTLAIEAALMGKNIAPGLNRSFVCEDWPGMAKEVWQEAREEAKAAIRDVDFRVLASDVDGAIIKVAMENARRAGVSEEISFQKRAVEDFSSSRKYGCIVCNPPYGEKTGEPAEVEKIYRAMGAVYKRLDKWSFFALTAHPHFERLFGRKADRKRKLYNGTILCYLYQYLGPLPKKRGAETAQDKVSEEG